MGLTRFTFFCALLGSLATATADVGVVLYESKGVDSRRNNSGHIALIATNLCADGIDKVRRCNAGEDPGVVITRYLNLAYGYDRYVFVAPIRDHFYATSNPALIPVLSDDDTLESMQIAYWREHLRPYLSPLSEQRYQQLRERARDLDHAFRGMVSLETVLGSLEPQVKRDPYAPVALMDPATKELIPDGHWRQAIGTAHLRSSMIITAPATPEQEERLIRFVAATNKIPFQAVADNCSDFVERGLKTVYADSGLHFRPRIANVADIWVTNPLPVATDFVAFAKRERLPLSVEVVPMVAGTRRSTAPIRSLARGVLVPDPNQGKLIFGLKVALNVFNPLLGATAFTVDKLSRFADLQQLAHDYAGSDGSTRARTVLNEERAAAPPVTAPQAVRVFGTTACWKAKQEEFAQIAARAAEAELLSGAERALLLKPDRPFLLPQYYRKNAAHVFGHGPDEIRRMADAPETRLSAFRAMLSVMNYYLSSTPLHRPTAEEFDRDWALFLDVSDNNGLRIAPSDAAREGVAACSCREYGDNSSSRDALADSRRLRRSISREARLVVYGRNR